MNVSLQNIDKVSALLTVKLEKADYQEKVDKALKSFRQKAQMPGFRKGMVPMSLEMVDNQVKSYTQRNGKYDKVDVYADNDMLKGLLSELDEQGNTKEGGIQVEGAVMMPSYMKNDEQSARIQPAHSLGW